VTNSTVVWLVLAYLLAVPTGLAWVVLGPHWALSVLTATATFQVIWLQAAVLRAVQDGE
jgi:hypothetical protein